MENEIAAYVGVDWASAIRRDAQALRGLSGVAPVTRRSGMQMLVVMRQAYPHRLRAAVFHWARVAVMRDCNCRNRYAALRKRGHSHARALRSIGSRLIGVACAMLRTGELFDSAHCPRRRSADEAVAGQHWFAEDPTFRRSVRGGNRAFILWM
jgi:hypothetical protein